MPGIWVFAESREQTLELLNAGQSLAREIGGPLIAFAIAGPEADLAQIYIEHGADEVLLLPPLPKDQPREAYVPALVETARQGDPEVFLLGGTLSGNEMAARIAAQLKTGLVSGCTGLKYEPAEKGIILERLIYGGAAVQTLVCKTRPIMATIAPRTFAPAEPQLGRTGPVRDLPAPPASPLKVVSRSPKVREAADLSEARIIVGVGRGIEKAEDLEIARELARTIGAALGCTRPLAEDFNWMPIDSYIGISGQKVKPQLYIGIGISGQIHHLSGLRDTKIICAINSDENAPIFAAADYGIVGNLYEVLPELTQELNQTLNK
jgi:electron transfer flavoprotein alpha subunit